MSDKTWVVYTDKNKGKKINRKILSTIANLHSCLETET